MKYKVTLNKRVYEVEVEEGSAMLIDEYELAAPAAPAAPVAAARHTADMLHAPRPAAPAAPVAAAPVAVAAPVAAAPAAAPAAGLAAGEVVKSPMPGNILKINAVQGQAVKEGDVLVVLEAMKMENDVVAPRDGTVAQVVVAKGAVVETGSPLVVLA